MQTILGAGGGISNFLVKELQSFTDNIRLVSRNPKTVTGNEELLAADLTVAADADRAVAGSDVVYLVVGLPYQFKLWEKQWPLLMQNVIEACLKHRSKLVFFDNIYAIDTKEMPMITEKSSYNPPSKKGTVRLQVLKQLEKAHHEKGLEYLIARSADFYGPEAANGILNQMLIDPFSKRKMGMWQSNANKIHSFTYVPDAAKATALLGNTPVAFGQIWNLPTSTEKLTGADYATLTASITGAKKSMIVLKPWMFKLMGLFVPLMKELAEMQYQNTQDYYFDSCKFCQAFDFTPTSYEEGIRASYQK